jgi:hypothetical protein
MCCDRVYIFGERMGPNRWTLPGGARLLIPARHVDSATIREIRSPEPDRSWTT